MAKGIKTGGRQAGTPNKLTNELRAELKNALHHELSLLPFTLRQLAPKERLEILAKLIPYVLPKIESVYLNEGEPLD